MPAFLPTGTNITERITFNSGTLNFGNNTVVDLDNVSVAVDYTINDLYILNSIKPAANARSNQKVMLTAKVKSFPPELYMMALGSSTAGNPIEIDTLDGQPTLQSPVLTFFDRHNKQYQFQFTGAIFKSSKMTAKMEDYAEFDFELEALDLLALDYTT